MALHAHLQDDRSGGVHPRLIVYYASPPGRGQAPTLQCDTIPMRRICGRGQAPTLQCETNPMRRLCGRGQAPTPTLPNKGWWDEGLLYTLTSLAK